MSSGDDELQNIFAAPSREERRKRREERRKRREERSKMTREEIDLEYEEILKRQRELDLKDQLEREQYQLDILKRYYQLSKQLQDNYYYQGNIEELRKYLMENNEVLNHNPGRLLKIALIKKNCYLVNLFIEFNIQPSYLTEDEKTTYDQCLELYFDELENNLITFIEEQSNQRAINILNRHPHLLNEELFIPAINSHNSEIIYYLFNSRINTDNLSDEEYSLATRYLREYNYIITLNYLGVSQEEIQKNILYLERAIDEGNSVVVNDYFQYRDHDDHYLITNFRNSYILTYAIEHGQLIIADDLVRYGAVTDDLNEENRKIIEEYLEQRQKLRDELREKALKNTEEAESERNKTRIEEETQDDNICAICSDAQLDASISCCGRPVHRECLERCGTCPWCREPFEINRFSEATRRTQGGGMYFFYNKYFILRCN